MKSKVLINARRKRRIPKHFSWIDHRLVRENYLKQCSTDALALYLFLVIVGDHEGLSYYGDERVKSYLNFSSSSGVNSCRKELEKSNLIAYLNGLYQVLGLESDVSFEYRSTKAINDETAVNYSRTENNSATESVRDVINRIFGGM
jgi:hypothetical protein